MRAQVRGHNFGTAVGGHEDDDGGESRRFVRDRFDKNMGSRWCSWLYATLPFSSAFVHLPF